MPKLIADVMTHVITDVPASGVEPALPHGLPHRELPHRELSHREQAQPVYPVFLTQLASVITVVVGGGTVAARKVGGLLAAEADVYVISPELTSTLHEHYRAGRLVWIAREYRAGDLAQASLVVAATNARAVNRAVAQEARARGILCNVADVPAEGNFHVPAVVREADVVVAVGTGGTQPRRAVQLRDWIAQQLRRYLGA